ncbi:MAG TPA: D-alanine--D-alanine ligase family protein, partial [Polyangia bacterium]
MKKTRVIILFGGRSAEHEISLLSARNVLSALDRTRFEPVLIGIDKAGRWHRESERTLAAAAGDPRRVMLDASAPAVGIEDALIARAPDGPEAVDVDDVVFPVLHGTFGEDGTVQGAMELAGIAYVGAGVLGSAIGMDKVAMKRMFTAAGLEIGGYLALRAGHDVDEFCGRAAQALGLPCFVKPSNMGSSVGVSKARTADELRDAVEHALSFDEWVLAEEMIRGREIEVGVLGDDPPAASLPGEVVPAADFYDYADKYEDGKAQLLAPAPISAHQ